MYPRTLLFVALIALVAACNSSGAPRDVDAAREESAKQITTIQWIDSVRDFGKITEGQRLAVSFRFRNAGNKPLVIESVHPACGCTVANYPKEPIAPGEEAEITGEFNSDGREGQNHKEITVNANTAQRTHNLIFDVNVVGKPSKQEATN